MTLMVLALGWTAVSVVSGLFLGTLLHRYGDGLAPSWDLACTLDDSAVAPLESHAAPRHHTTR
jgi:hypothetical protein